MKQKHPTYVSVVFEYLKKLDDFAPLTKIAADTMLGRSVVLRSLLMLKSYKAVDTTDVGGVAWWCASPNYDQRSKIYTEWSEHTRKPHKRKPKAKPAAAPAPQPE